jgi:hypothetical protein
MLQLENKRGVLVRVDIVIDTAMPKDTFAIHMRSHNHLIVRQSSAELDPRAQANLAECFLHCIDADNLEAFTPEEVEEGLRHCANTGRKR